MKRVATDPVEKAWERGRFRNFFLVVVVVVVKHYDPPAKGIERYPKAFLCYEGGSFEGRPNDNTMGHDDHDMPSQSVTKMIPVGIGMPKRDGPGSILKTTENAWPFM